ncbi:MAG: endonuclease/exonuclease/phosphatase family protein [Campylobacterota bacterium]|nr:endonuclease/exonuclease/phosphatase family protein [Campylobacterota bacterium]
MKITRFIFIISFFSFYIPLFLSAKNFTVATYNVENLFDLKYDGTEYKEYKPNTKTWNKRIFHKKIKNISKTINHLNADILALQEIESEQALRSLLKKSSQYKYSKFIKKRTTSVGVALFSKYPIISYKKIDIDSRDKYSRDILKIKVLIDDKELLLYVNHWRSKRAPESTRIIYATALKRDIDGLPENTDYIILGDLNANYDEYLSFKYDKKLNNSYGITGINQILNTTIDGNFVHKYNIKKFDATVHYNLWLDIDMQNRFSSKFRGDNNTPDNIIISKGLFDNNEISYVDNSFRVFKPKYLYNTNNGRINRWNRKKISGYSDHLPIVATFSTTLQKYNFKITSSKKFQHTIDELYQLQNVRDYDINDAIVIYKNNKIAIIKQNKNGRAIMIYKPTKELIVGKKYNITVEEIDLYNGLKEIKRISYIKKTTDNYDAKKFYIDGRKIDLFDLKYQNEIVKNLRGKYKKGYLYFKHSNKSGKIKLYFDKKIKRPKAGETITITSGHLGIYKSKIQIILYSKKDFK